MRVLGWAMANLHELIVQDGVRRGAGSLQELVQALPRAIIYTVGAQHVQLLQLKILFH